MYGSEQAMAEVAAEHLGTDKQSKVLLGGLGMGFTLRAALDYFSNAEVTVAEMMPAIVEFNRGELGEMTSYPLKDERVILFEGLVQDAVGRGKWDAILLDVDNGPEAFTLEKNAELYGSKGIRKLVNALSPGGIVVVWSAFESLSFEKTVRNLGLAIETKKVRARASGKGPRHTLFLVTEN